MTGRQEMPKSASQVIYYDKDIFLRPDSSFNYLLGSSRHQRVKTKMGAAKGRESNNKHLQTLSSQRATEKVKGYYKAVRNFSFMVLFVIGSFPRGRKNSGRIQESEIATEGKEYG